MGTLSPPSNSARGATVGTRYVVQGRVDSVHFPRESADRPPDVVFSRIAVENIVRIELREKFRHVISIDMKEEYHRVVNNP